MGVTDSAASTTIASNIQLAYYFSLCSLRCWLHQGAGRRKIFYSPKGSGALAAKPREKAKSTMAKIEREKADALEKLNVDKNSIELYKAFSSGFDGIAERRRAYTTTFMTFLGVIAIAPYAITSAALNRLDPDSLNEPLTIIWSASPFVAASIIGMIVSRYWEETSKRHRLLISFRESWLGLMEEYLVKRKAIPNFARVYTFEENFLFDRGNPNAEKGRDKDTTASVSLIDIKASELFGYYFGANPIFYCFSAYFFFIFPSRGASDFKCDLMLVGALSAGWLFLYCIFSKLVSNNLDKGGAREFRSFFKKNRDFGLFRYRLSQSKVTITKHHLDGFDDIEKILL